jgi:hypothetical protein
VRAGSAGNAPRSNATFTSMNPVVRMLLLGAVIFAAGCGEPPRDPARESPPRAPETRRSPLRLPPQPERRHGHRAELLPDGRVLVFGGVDAADASADLGMRATWVFDPLSGAWSRTGNLNTPMAFHASAVAAGAVHAIGGAVERFDAASGAWRVVLPDETFAKSHLAAAGGGDRILIVGGYPESRPRCAMLDAATLAWSELPPYPGAGRQDHFHFVAAFDGVFHVAGGFSGADLQIVASHYAWDGRSWTPRAPIPSPDVAKVAAWAVDPERRRLIVFGMSGNYAYDARAGAWSSLPKPPWTGDRVMPACFVRDGYLFVLGGFGERRDFGVDVFDLVAARWLE